MYRGLLLCCLLLVVVADYENMEDCAIMPENKCKDSSLCQWREPQCRIGVSKCDGLPAPICNAAEACKFELEGNTCRNTMCLNAYTSSECKSYNVHSLDCIWLEDDKRCISTNTCKAQVSQEGCRELSSHGCGWQGSRGCWPHDPCGGKSPTKCMSEGSSYKCWTTPGDCYGHALGNLDKKISEGSKYELSLEQNTLTHNEQI